MRAITFIDNATKLIEVKQSIHKLQQEEKELKSKLKPHVILGEPLVFTEGKIYQRSQKNAKSFCREQLLKFIESRFGTEVAAAVDYHCTRRISTAKRIHVQLIEKKE